MSVDLSHHSSVLHELDEFHLGEDGDFDGSSITSEESELSAERLATHPEYGVVWELLHLCHEAAFGDVPERYRDCLSIFDTTHNTSKPESVAFQVDEGEIYNKLFQTAGAIQTSSEPWSLPFVMRHLSKEDALWPPNIRVLTVTQVVPTAAVYLNPDITINSNESTKFDIESSTSPLVHPTGPLFTSAIFTSASQISERKEMPSFHALRKYNRLATTSVLRQAHSLHIDVPVFGVLLRGPLVTFHIDWYEERDSIMESNSAFYTTEDDVEGIKIWDLRRPAEALEVILILSNLRQYTSGAYASRVYEGLQAVKGPIIPWKWAASRLPECLAYSQLQKDPEEPVEAKMERWQESVGTSMNHRMPMAWTRRKLDAEMQQKKKWRKIRPLQTAQRFLVPPFHTSIPRRPSLRTYVEHGIFIESYVFD